MRGVLSDGGPIVATGPRVDLRRLGAADAAKTAELLAESAEFHRPWVTYPTRPDKVTAFLVAAPGQGMEVLGVRRHSDDALVGLTTLCRIAGEPWLTAECGAAVGVRYQGNGYLAEGMRLLVWFAVGTLGLHRVEALAQPGNVRSGRMLTTAGFRPEGTARGAIRIGGKWLDHVRWAITADDLAASAGEGVI